MVNADTPSMPEGWSVSANRRIRFNETARLVYFGTAEIPHLEPAGNFLEEEKVRVDLWHYLDPLIQSQQLV